ncbi:erv26 super protein [Acarospora aff. strigata]|nr:erv26 super protein [Acarospora aff. strigata]
MRWNFFLFLPGGECPLGSTRQARRQNQPGSPDSNGRTRILPYGALNVANLSTMHVPALPPSPSALPPVTFQTDPRHPSKTASGLYYLSELVEEHTVLAKKLLTRLIYSIISIHLLLTLIDGFPFLLSLLSVGSHVVYAGNLRRFPIVRLGDPLFILSCILVLLNHYLLFRHFSHPASYPSSYYPPRALSSRSAYNDPGTSPTFTEIAAYFGICVWLVPFSLFVSLSAGENVLPSMGSEYATGDGGVGGPGGTGDGRGRGRDHGHGHGHGHGRGLVKVAVDGVREWVGETGELLGFWRGERTRRF